MKSIFHKLLIKVPAEQVYSAITTQDGLSGWWTSDTKAVPEVNSIARFAFGPEYFKEMKIMELQPFTQVKWLCVAGYANWIGTTISFELQPDDKGTWLLFRHDGWLAYTPAFADCNYTWALFLRNLKLLCETGQAQPAPNHHQ